MKHILYSLDDYYRLVREPLDIRGVYSTADNLLSNLKRNQYSGLASISDFSDGFRLVGTFDTAKVKLLGEFDSIEGVIDYLEDLLFSRELRK